MSLIAATVTLLAATQLALGAEYFLSPNGSDAAPGTRQRPWQTIAQVNATLQPGDTATFLDGEYPGVIQPARSGRADAPITYRAARRHGATLTGGKAANEALQTVYLQGREYIVIDGFQMLPTRGGWIRMEDSHHCIIRHCHMENATRGGSPFRCDNCTYNRYLYNDCWRTNTIGKYGHVAGDCWNNFNCSYNIFEGNHISRAAHRPFGLRFDSKYNVVRRNIFDCRWGRNFEFFSTPRLLFEDNIVTNGFDGSGSADGRAKLFVIDSIVRRNLIYRNWYGPMVINAYKYRTDAEPFGMKRSRVYHNVFFRNHQYGYEMSDLSRDPNQPKMVFGNLFVNNIFFDNDPCGDHLALLLWANIAEDNCFFSNDLCGDRPGRQTVRYDLAGPSSTHWPGLKMTAAEANQQKPKQFADNIDADPLFVDAEADDYRLRPNSPCLDAGRPLARVKTAGRGRDLPVDDARCFYDGFGIEGEQGDLVMIGPQKRLARVVQADIESNVLTLDREIAFQAGDGVSLPYTGKAPDLGAYERGAEQQDWYRAPRVPPGLRLPTMETATEPTVVVDFEAHNQEQWFYLWNFSRQRNTDARMDDTTAASGRRSMRVFATADQAILACDIRPRWWDLDRFPWVKFSYRIPPGVPVGLWLYAFRSTEVGQGAVCVGGSPARRSEGYRDLDKYKLQDDDQWHEVTLDARLIRQVFPKVKVLQMFRFYTRSNANKGQHFWFDNFSILPVGEAAP